MTNPDYKKEPHPIWAKFLDGKLDLQTAFLGYLIGATFVHCLICILLISIGWSSNKTGSVGMAIGVFFICNRTWACANNYIKEKNNKDQPVVWGILTQCVCALNALSMIAILYDVFFS